MEDSKVCFRCFAYIPKDSIYCPSCGINLNKEELEIKEIKTKGERKYVTIMFILIERPLIEKLDEKVFKERIETLSEINRLAKEFGGWIDKWIGLNGAMIIFGIPRTKRMDAEIACELALKIEDYLKNKNLKYKIGINSGWVYFGEIGSDIYTYKTVIGDTVNMAYRLAEIADSEIIISEETNSLVEERFFTTKKKKVFLKGKREIISLYELKELREKPKEMRFRIPFIGREEELEILNSYKELLKQKKGNVLFIKGPPGIGKTTLKNYWLKMFKEKNDFYIFEVEPIFEIHGNPIQTIQRSLETFFEREYFFDHEIREEIEPYSYIELLKFKLRTFLESLLEIKPVIFIVDSIEKIDEFTKTLIEYLLITLNNKIFFLLLGRENLLPYEFTFIKERNLLPFNFEEIKTILKSFFKEEINDDFVKKILEITEGIPLYVTEFLKVISRKGTKTIEIPGTLIGSILEFYDILNKEEKEVLKKMSVLIEWDENGDLKDFFNENEKKIINDLVEEEIFEKVGSRYKFINPLIRNVIYDAILKKEKIEMHSKIIEKIINKIDLKKFSSYLFYHAYNAELWEKAFEFALLSGKERILQGSFKEAIDYFNKSEECFQKLKEKDFIRLSEVFEYRAEAKRSLGLLEEAIKDIHKSIVILEGTKDNKIFLLKQKLSELYLEKNELEPCKKLTLEILNEKGKISDDIIASSHLVMGNFYFILGQYTLSLLEYNKAYGIMRNLENKKLYKIALMLSELHKEIGNFEFSMEYLKISDEILKTKKDILWEFRLMKNKFDLYLKIGNFKEMFKEIDEIIAKAKFLENNYYYFVFLTLKALLLSYLKDKELAKKIISEALTISSNFKNDYKSLFNLAKAMYLIEEKSYFLNFLRELYKFKEKFHPSLLIDLELLFAKISDKDAEKHIEKAFEISKKITSPYIHLLVFCAFVDVYSKKGDKEKVYQYLRRANFLLKELSEKFKNQNLKKLFLSHPDFETINTLSSLHF
jgi:class 3 adenylate cyclase/tetratricopeptide (TPR) repeat protein